MRRKPQFGGRLVRAEDVQLLRPRGTRLGGPGGESARLFRCAALVLLALFASPAGLAAAAGPSPDPHPTAKAPAATGGSSPSPDPTPAARDAAASTPAPSPAPAPAPAPEQPAGVSSQPVQSAPSSPEPATSTTAQQTPRAKTKPASSGARKEQRRTRAVQPASEATPRIPGPLERAAAATVAVASPSSDGGRLFLGGLALLTLVLASGSMLVLLARGGALETRA